MARHAWGNQVQEEIAAECGLTRRTRAPRRSRSEAISDLRLVEFVFEAMAGITERDFKILKAVLAHPTYRAAGEALAPGEADYSPYVSRRIRKMREAARRLLSTLRGLRSGAPGFIPISPIEPPNDLQDRDPAFSRVRTGQLLPTSGRE